MSAFPREKLSARRSVTGAYFREIGFSLIKIFFAGVVCPSKKAAPVLSNRCCLYMGGKEYDSYLNIPTNWSRSALIVSKMLLIIERISPTRVMVEFLTIPIT